MVATLGQGLKKGRDAADGALIYDIESGFARSASTCQICFAIALRALILFICF